MIRLLTEVLTDRPGRAALRLSALVALEATIAMTLWVNTAGVTSRTNALLDAVSPTTAAVDYFVTRWAPVGAPLSPETTRSELAQLRALPGVARLAQVDIGAHRARLRLVGRAGEPPSAPFDAQLIRVSAVENGAPSGELFIDRPGFVVGPDVAGELFADPADAVGARLEDTATGATREILHVEAVVPPHIGVTSGQPVLLESVAPWAAAETTYVVSLDAGASHDAFAEAFDRVTAAGDGRVWHRASRPATWASYAAHLQILEVFLLAVSGGVAVMLIISIYAVSAYLVAARRRDLAVVRALGLRRRDLLRRQVLETCLWVGVGGLIGILPAWLWHDGMSAALSYTALPFWTPVVLVLVVQQLIAVVAALGSARRMAMVSPALASSEV